MENYNELLEEAIAIYKGMKDVKEGNIIDGEEALKYLEDTYF